MRILYVHERYGALGGAEANVVITATELARRGHAIGILHGPSTGRGLADWDAAFASRFPLDPSESPDTAATTDLALRSFRPDVVYVHKTADLALLESLLRSRLPLVRMVHDHDIYCLRSYKYDVFTRKICTRPASLACIFPCLACLVRNRDGRSHLPVRWASYRDKRREIAANRRFQRLVAVTPFMRDELLRNGFDADRIRVLAPVPRPGEPGLRSSFGPRNLVLFAGQIVRGKGVDVLLESLALVSSPFECVILGDGNHRPACERLARRLGLDDRVTFKGYVPQHELKAYFRECSVVAISSVWPEPIATVGLEVMRYALPIVAFDAGGIRDWLLDGHNGFLVPWMDRATFASRIDRLLQDKSLARTLGLAGLRLVSDRYDFDDYLRDLESLLEEVALPAETPALVLR